MIMYTLYFNETSNAPASARKYALYFYVNSKDHFWSQKTYNTPASARKSAYRLLEVMPKDAYAKIYDYRTDLFTEVLFIKDGIFKASDEDHIWSVNPKTGGLKH